MGDFQAGPALFASAHRLVSGTIMLVARASGESGRSARRSAVDDLFSAAKALELLLGRPVVAHLPDRSELMARLRDATAVVSQADGRPFRNRFVEVDLTAVCGVHVVVSTGTGRNELNSAVGPADLQ